MTVLRTLNSSVFSASLDHVNSVKVFDLEKRVVRYAFNDHGSGGALQLAIDE